MSKVKRIIFAFICAYLMTGLVAGMLGVLFQYGFALHGLGFDLVSGLSFFFYGLLLWPVYVLSVFSLLKYDRSNLWLAIILIGVFILCLLIFSLIFSRKRKERKLN